MGVIVGNDGPMYPGRILKLGADNNSDAVRALQLRLKELGCGDLQGTGFFGIKTDEAVRLFQARFTDLEGRAMEIDGEVGAITWSALFGPNSVPRENTATSALLGKALDFAITQVGNMENPLGSNRGPEVDQYLASVDINFPAAWCVAFIYFCYNRAANELGIANPMVKTGGVLNLWNRAGQANTRRISTEEARNNPSLVKPGMIFIIDTGPAGGAGHAGIVQSVTGGKLTTIEGNTNDNGSRDGIGVFRAVLKRRISGINKGFIDYGTA